MMDRFLSLRRLLVGALLVWPTLCLAQGHVAPGSDSILGYVHLSDPQGFAHRLMDMASPHSAGPQASLVRQMLGQAVGDPSLGIVPAGRSATWVMLRDPAGGAVESVLALPGESDPKYLANVARQLGLKTRSSPGLSLIGSDRALNLAAGEAKALKTLNDTVHPAAVSVFLRGEFLRGELDLTVKRLWPAHAGVGAVGSLSAPTGADPGSSANTGALPPFSILVAEQILQQVETVHIMLDARNDRIRLVVNLEAVAGSDLAKALSQGASPADSDRRTPQTNVLSNYLPPAGSVRLTASLGNEGFAELAAHAIEAAARKAQLPDEKRAALVEAARQSLFYKGRCGLSFTNPQSYLAIVTPVDPAQALENVEFCLEASLNPGLSAPSSSLESPPSPDGSALPPPGRGSLPPPSGSALSPPSGGLPSPAATTPQVWRDVVCDSEQGEPVEYEKFSVSRFREKGATGAAAKPLLVATRIGGYLALSANENEVKTLIRRLMLLETTLQPPLQAYSEFVAGGNLYADCLVSLSRNAPPSGFCLTGRFAESRAQLALSVPVETFGKTQQAVEIAAALLWTPASDVR